jgi:hypothetical protein
MNITYLLISLGLCCLGVLTTSSNAIGLQCIDKSKDTSRTSREFIIVSLVMAILCILLSFLGMYLSVSA